MRTAQIAALAGAIGLAGCGSGSSLSGSKTALTQEQFVEVKANCNLDGARLEAANSTQTTTNADGSTSTVSIKYEGAPDQTAIILPDGVAESDAAMALACLKGEFDRLGAEARLQLPENMGL